MTQSHLVPRSDGLRLRTAVPGDLAQIKQLLADRGEEADARDVELMLQDTDAGWDLCAVMVDGDRVVSTASLMDETIRMGEIELPAGQVELVATAVGYEGRGLVRALMTWAHDVSAARGHLVQAMIGIPYFYRLFGYEYAIGIPRLRRVSRTAPSMDRGFRPAVSTDLGDLTRLQDAAQASFDVSMPHSTSRRRWLLAHDSSTTYVVQRDGRAVATGRVQVDDDGILLAEHTAVDRPAAEELLAGVAGLRHGAPLRLVDRPGVVLDAADAEPVTDADAAQYYVRIPDVTRLLDALRPLLFRRLERADLTGTSEVVVSTFGAHYWMSIESDRLGPVVMGGPMQAPAAVGGAGVAPDQLGALIFGEGMAALAAHRPDVYAGEQRVLFETLFPAVTADLLTFYLPY